MNTVQFSLFIYRVCLAYDNPLLDAHTMAAI